MQSVNTARVPEHGKSGPLCREGCSPYPSNCFSCMTLTETQQERPNTAAEHEVGLLTGLRDLTGAGQVTRRAEPPA